MSAATPVTAKITQVLDPLVEPLIDVDHRDLLRPPRDKLRMFVEPDRLGGLTTGAEVSHAAFVSKERVPTSGDRRTRS